MAGWVLYCIALVTSGDWASRYEAWIIREAFGSMARKGCKMSVFYPEIRESTNQNSSTRDSAYSDPVLLRDYVRVRPDAFRLPLNAERYLPTACLQGAVRLAAREALVRLECIRYEGDRPGLCRGVAVKRGAGGGRGNATSLLDSSYNDGTTILQAKAYQTT